MFIFNFRIQQNGRIGTRVWWCEITRNSWKLLHEQIDFSMGDRGWLGNQFNFLVFFFSCFKWKLAFCRNTRFQNKPVCRSFRQIRTASVIFFLKCTTTIHKWRAIFWTILELSYISPKTNFALMTLDSWHLAMATISVFKYLRSRSVMIIPQYATLSAPTHLYQTRASMSYQAYCTHI